MTAITQLRTFGVLVGMPYGSLVKDASNTPDFLHGNLSIRLELDGRFEAGDVNGEVNSRLSLNGRVTVNP